MTFCQSLGRNKAIKTLMKKYLLIWNENDANEVNRVKEELKIHHLMINEENILVIWNQKNLN